MEKHFTVLVMSISTAASKWPSQHICNDTRPYLSLGSLAVLPCAVGRNLLGRCLCGFLCIGATCVGFLRPPKSTLFAVGLVCTCLSLLSSPFVSWGLCSLALAPQACTLLGGACVHCSSPRPASAPGAPAHLFPLSCLPSARVDVHLFCVTTCILCHGSYLFFRLCWEGCVEIRNFLKVRHHI